MAEFKWKGKNGANLEGTEDADWLRLDGCYDCKVFGYGGDDTVRITDCSYTILYAGDGDNDIDWKGSKYCSISSGAGNDTINVWLYGGTGYHILCGAGNDSVWGCDGIWVPDAAFTKAEIHGDDLWAYVGDDRGVIIKNAVGKELKYFDASCTEIKTCKL